MNSKKLSIKINKSAKEIFDFLLNPSNTPKWIDSIQIEETNEWPAKLGTVYKNKDEDNKWNEFILTQFEPYKFFELTSQDGNYHVQYTLDDTNTNSTKINYYEWVEEGELEVPFEKSILEKLKSILEFNNL